MKFKLEIDCTNEAFMPEPSTEVARLLRRIADMIEKDEAPLEVWDDEWFRDINGNRVAKIKVEL